MRSISNLILRVVYHCRSGGDTSFDNKENEPAENEKKPIPVVMRLILLKLIIYTMNLLHWIVTLKMNDLFYILLIL